MAVGYRGGLITGKIGGDVGYMVKNAKGRTSQGWRAYQAHVSNPNNYAQRFNRVILSTMAKAYSTLRPICDHSFEGIAGPSRNQKEFAKQNIHILQELARNGLGNYNPRNEFRMLSNPLMVSKGSLPALNSTVSASAFQVLLPSGINEAVPRIGEFFDAMGWTNSGQITLLFCASDSSADIILFRFVRIVFVLGETYNGGQEAVLTRDTPLYTSLSEDPTDNVLHYNVAKSEGAGSLLFAPVTASGAFMGFTFQNLDAIIADTQLVAGAGINSSLVGNAWKRSTQMLTCLDDGVDAYSLARAIASYDTVQDSSLYLNNGGRVILNG